MELWMGGWVRQPMGLLLWVFRITVCCERCVFLLFFVFAEHGGCCSIK